MNKTHVRNESKIRSLADLYNFVSAYGKHGITGVVYRGVSSHKYDLVPRIGRLKHHSYPEYDQPDETKMLSLFKQQAFPHVDKMPDSEWEMLALAQHYGMPTRLLDWSKNPLVACFFAVEEEYAASQEGDSVVYALQGGRYIDVTKGTDPFGISSSKD